jgi:predicted PurR-regulated permease PerM
MHDPEKIILIVLAIVLLILLVLSIIVVYIIIRILQNVQHISQKVSDTTDSIPEALRGVAKKLAPLALSTALGSIVKKAVKKRKFREDDDE